MAIQSNHSKASTKPNRSVIASEERTMQSFTLLPKLRFKEFKGEWEVKRYGEIYSFYTTNSFSRDNLNYKKGEVKNIHYGDIHTKFSMLFDIDKEIVPFINEEIDLSRIKNENYCQEGDLVIADASEDYNDVGKTIEIINLNNEKTLAGLHTFLARPNKYKMQKGFAGYLVQSWKVRKQIMTIAQGSKVLGIATGRLSKIILDIPKLPEQQKIANFLTAVDTKLQQLTRKKTLLEVYKKGVMQQLFSQQLRFKPDASQLSLRGTKQSVTNETQFPDWEEKKFGSVAKFINGKAYKQIELLSSGKYRVLRVGNLFSNNEWYYSDLELDNDKYIEKGDLIYAWSASFGPRFWDEEKVIYHYHIWKVKPNKEVNKNFLYHVFMYDVDKIKLQSQGGTMFHITKGNIESRIFKFPIVKEQQKIANYLSALDAKIELVHVQITKTQGFKKGLLQGMFV
ncbi:restriction endonuclease subunit S [Winogradskyella eximia]|uniref:restriction endonuclease subunit S n=1 Tax=Winogradskyella eximia TaxID=262006 RepID=UPI002492F8C2|nr:restriction endonuclease subunit S [Winogradskyella eximia]